MARTVRANKQRRKEFARQRKQRLTVRDMQRATPHLDHEILRLLMEHRRESR